MPNKKNSLDIAPPVKKEPRLQENYDGKNEQVGEEQGLSFNNAGEYLAHYANRYDYPNYTSDNNLGSIPGVQARKQMNQKALDIAYDNEDTIWDNIDKLDERKLNGTVQAGEEEEIKKQEATHGSISNAARKNTKRGEAFKSYRKAAESQERIELAEYMNDPMDTDEISHADRVTESRKRTYASPEGPGYQR